MIARVRVAGCALVLVGLAYACGDDAPTAPEPPPLQSEGGPKDDGGGRDSSSDSGPVRAPFGLDARPPNPSCIGRGRPQTSVVFGVTPAFPSLPAMPGLVGAYQAPNDSSRWYAMTLEGRMYSFPNQSNASALTPFVDLRSEVHTGGPGGEGGLLGFAFHPQWATNRTAFVSYTTGLEGFPDAINESRVSRIKSTDGGLTLDPATEEVLLSNTRNFYGHNGGNLAFGPDGYLYMSFGDDGVADDPDDNGQRLDTPFAKILRVGAAATGAFTIPADNPFQLGTNRKETYARGLRNAWRWSFDRASGALWVGDVGQNQYEEVDIVQKGGNYGWRLREGAHCRPPTAPPCSGDGSLIEPVVDYEHPLGFGGPGSVTGGFVYRGKAVPELVGTYVFADYSIGALSVVEEDPRTGVRAIRKIMDTADPIASFAEDNDGELYPLELVAGRLLKLTRTSGATTNPMPTSLSASGCFDASDPQKVLPALVPFDVNAPSWSDGAETSRWLALPDGTSASVVAEGRFELPIGAVVAQELRVSGKRIETRLLVRHDDGDWGGYSYAWNDAQSDAVLLPSSSARSIAPGFTWSFPSRGECLSCHASAAGRTLGLEVAQLRRDVVYASTNRISPQLETLEHIGFVTAATTATSIPSLVAPFGAGALDVRARSYLHANCAGCHRPGAAVTTIDLRASTRLGPSLGCDVVPVVGSFGIANARVIRPGSAAMSLLVQRSRWDDAYRMPPRRHGAPDTNGAALLEAWANGLTACPP